MRPAQAPMTMTTSPTRMRMTRQRVLDMRNVLAFLTLGTVLATTPVLAQKTAKPGDGKPNAQEKHEAEAGKPDPEAAVASAVEDAQPKHGSVTTAGGRKIEYT